jgi:hypothetical protein
VAAASSFKEEATPVRDLQRLEELSSAAALGLWADDVVLALDRATSTRALAEVDAELLSSAAEMLDAALARAEQPLAPSPSARSLAATNTALVLVATLAREQPGTDERDLLRQMVALLRQAATAGLKQQDVKGVQSVMELFGLLGEHQLVRSNSVLASRKGAAEWTGTRKISNS